MMSKKFTIDYLLSDESNQESMSTIDNVAEVIAVPRNAWKSVWQAVVGDVDRQQMPDKLVIPSREVLENFIDECVRRHIYGNAKQSYAGAILQLYLTLPEMFKLNKYGTGILNPFQTKTRNELDILLIKYGQIDEAGHYVCHLCRRKFKSRAIMRRHMQKHSVGFRVMCCAVPNCFKTFNDCFDLTRHVRCHTGIRPFKCDQCDRRFTQLVSMENHRRAIHRVPVRYSFNEPRAKLYVCELCEFTSSDRGQHRQHVVSRHAGSFYAVSLEQSARSSNPSNSSDLGSSHDKNVGHNDVGYNERYLGQDDLSYQEDKGCHNISSYHDKHMEVGQKINNIELTIKSAVEQDVIGKIFKSVQHVNNTKIIHRRKSATQRHYHGEIDQYTSVIDVDYLDDQCCLGYRESNQINALHCANSFGNFQTDSPQI